VSIMLSGDVYVCVCVSQCMCVFVYIYIYVCVRRLTMPVVSPYVQLIVSCVCVCVCMCACVCVREGENDIYQKKKYFHISHRYGVCVYACMCVRVYVYIYDVCVHSTTVHLPIMHAECEPPALICLVDFPASTLTTSG